jgi:hypothetical protein
MNNPDDNPFRKPGLRGFVFSYSPTVRNTSDEKPKKPRKASLKRLANVAKKQGVAVTVTSDGAVTVSPTLNAEVASTEWDEALAK